MNRFITKTYYYPNGSPLNRELCLVLDRHPRDVPPPSCTRPYRLLINRTWSKENPRECRSSKIHRNNTRTCLYTHTFIIRYTYYNILYHKGLVAPTVNSNHLPVLYIYIGRSVYIRTQRTNQ